MPAERVQALVVFTLFDVDHSAPALRRIDARRARGKPIRRRASGRPRDSLPLAPMPVVFMAVIKGPSWSTYNLSSPLPARPGRVVCAGIFLVIAHDLNVAGRRRIRRLAVRVGTALRGAARSGVSPRINAIADHDHLRDEMLPQPLRPVISLSFNFARHVDWRPGARQRASARRISCVVCPPLLSK